MSKFHKIAAAWKNKGEGYSGKFSEDVAKDSRFLIFKNKDKKEDKHPDLILGFFEDGEAPKETPKEDETPF